MYMYYVQTLVEQCPTDDTDTEFNMGCVLFKVFSSSATAFELNTLQAHTMYTCISYRRRDMKRQRLNLTQFYKSWATEQVHMCVVAIFLAKHAHAHHKVSSAISYPIVFPSTRHLLLSGTVPLHDEAVCSVSQVHLRCDRERHQGPPRAQHWHADGGC